MKLTPWFDANQKPVRVGVYLTRLGKKRHPLDGYCHWDGKEWSGSQGSANTASHYRLMSSYWQARQWRGVEQGEGA